MTLRIVFSPEAKEDLLSLYEYIAQQSGERRAIAYIEQIEAYCQGFDVVATRGARRDDIRKGLRIVGFKRRVAIAFHVEPDRVIFNRILYGGQDIERAFH